MHRKKNAKEQVLFIALIVGAVVLAFLTARFLPVPEKAVKLVFFLGVVIYVALGVGISKLVSKNKRY